MHRHWIRKLGSAAPLKDFLWDGKGEGFDCPPLADISAKLAANPNDARGKLCVGEFLRLTLGDDFALSTPPDSG